ncbi:hypothetical protein [Streptomyces sp. NBC_00154]|uniref:hypothetical protein n=1 Tax=Streptomyces sp. NBC_00154 TaxID=2975670 RepID=UPI00224E6A55|nr:hypothetical protein [Streptomyces sp. NBC_00154]MCX5317218.1 hypothetical protein [Streptomyces sp. NBC_00154]
MTSNIHLSGFDTITAKTLAGASLADPQPHCRLGQIEVPTERSPRRHRSTIPALNSGVNEWRGRGFFFLMLSMMDILPVLNP